MLITLFLACSPATELPQASNTLGALELVDRSAPAATRLLDKLHDFQLDLTDTNLPASGLDSGQFSLDGRWRRARKSSASGWVHANPIELSRKRYSAPPNGISLEHTGQPLEYGKRTGIGKKAHWSIGEEGVVIYSPTSPSTWPNPPVLISHREQSLQNRLNLQTSGLAAEEHVAYKLTLGAITRPGMLLSAPGSAALEVALPMKAHLLLGTTIVPRTLKAGTESDGAEIIVEFNGKEVDRSSISNNGEFEEMDLDLSEYGGTSGTLTLRTEAGDSPDFDHVFLANPQIVGAPEGLPRRVLFIGIDTLRYASMTQHGYSRDTTAPLDGLASSSVIFENAYAPAPRTRPSFRTALTGRLPLPAMEATGIGERFRALGFHTAGITANVHLVPRFGFDAGFDYWHYDNGADAELQVSRAKSWLSKNATRDSFLFLHLMDPHTFYRAPGLFANRYVETSPGPLKPEMNRWRIAQLEKSKKLTPDNRAWLQSRYDGEVRYMAEELAGLLSWVLNLPGQTLVVLHSDHGEEFWEHGGYEHNHTLYNELVHAVLWIRPPMGWANGPHRVTEPTGLVDIVPTLIDLFDMDTEGTSPTDGISLAPFLDASRAGSLQSLQMELSNRALPFGHLMYAKERWAVVAKGHKYMLETISGEEELYEVATDPREQRQVMPLYSESQLDGWRAELERATGWPVGAGWRVHIKRAPGPFSLAFDEPVEAGLLDPEAGRTRRANIEWGDGPSVELEDIGEVQVSPDGLEVFFTPGKKARKGILAIKLAQRAQTATLRAGDILKPVESEGGRIAIGQLDLDIQAGIVILPQDSVRQRMAQGQGPVQAASDSALDALRALGYVE